jgi:hypothetical protein
VSPQDRPRATIRLLQRCNNVCGFCAQDGLPLGAPADVGADLMAARSANDEITFVGGEPTLDPSLEAHIAAARTLGFGRIGVQTNGSRLADAAYTTRLARAGLTDVHLSLHGGDARVHDYHTGRPGSFGEILAAMHAARVNGLPVAVTTVLTRSNFRVLHAMPSLLAARGVAAWCISVAVTAGRAAAHRDRMIPRLGLALPFALHALAAADALKIPGWIGGAPLCLLGPAADRSQAGPGRAYAPACESCAGRPACPGIDGDYLVHFGADEVARREAPRASPPDAIARMFVGTGELALLGGAASPPASRPRTSLPLLGKVKPALAEAPAGAERRTGDALKEILPGLFQGGDSKP